MAKFLCLGVPCCVLGESQAAALLLAFPVV